MKPPRAPVSGAASAGALHSFGTKVARLGGSLLFNNFGCLFYTSWENQIHLMKQLCDAGFQDQVLISIDVTWTWNQAGVIEHEGAAEHPEAARRTFAYMAADTVPALLASGFSEDDIDGFLERNPRRFFSNSGNA